MRGRTIAVLLFLLVGVAPLRAGTSSDRLAYVALASPQDRTGAVTIFDPATGQLTATGGSAAPGSVLMWSRDGRLAWWAGGGVWLWDGKAVTELSRAALHEDGSPAWSADGRLAWTESRDPNFRRIVVWDGQTILDVGEGRAPAWSADGRLAWLDGGGSQEVHVWDGQRVTILDDKSTVDEGPAWSDDGRLARTVNDTNQFAVKLWDGKTTVMTAPDLTDGYALRPAWSSDGRLAWTQINRNREIMVWDGKATVNVSDSPADDDFPVWSSDGRLAWESRSGVTSDIFVWDGKTAVNVSNDPARDTGAVWSSDGRLAWTAYGESGPRIMLWDGATVSRLLGDALAASPAWSGARQPSWIAE